MGEEVADVGCKVCCSKHGSLRVECCVKSGTLIDANCWRREATEVSFSIGSFNESIKGADNLFVGSLGNLFPFLRRITVVVVFLCFSKIPMFVISVNDDVEELDSLRLGGVAKSDKVVEDRSRSPTTVGKESVRSRCEESETKVLARSRRSMTR